MAYLWVAGEEVTAAKLNQTSDGLDNASITYDANGRVATIVDNNASKTYTFTYDTNNRVSTVTDGTFTWTLAYNSANQITSITKA